MRLWLQAPPEPPGAGGNSQCRTPSPAFIVTVWPMGVREETVNTAVV